MKRIELKKLFVRFLKEENCYNSFKKNMRMYIFDQKFYRLPIDEIFTYSDNPIEEYFKWSATKEGYDYWKKISVLWTNLYYDTLKKR